MIRLQERGGTFLPTRAQHHLLRAALLSDRVRVAESLAEWKALAQIDDLEHGSRRMLPLLYRNLKQQGIADPILPRLKSVYRQVWFRNHLIIEHGLRAWRVLSGDGIAVILLKGSALVATVYEDVALRPMEDFDILVSRADFRRAIGILTSTGWQLDPPLLDPESHYAFQHAVSFRCEGGGSLDLHWSAMGLPLYGQQARQTWLTATPARLGGHEVRVPSLADQLMVICTHATLRNKDVAPIRWAADAILLNSQTPIPWQSVVEAARARSLSLTMLLSLEYLRDGLDAVIPEQVMSALAKHAGPRERLALKLLNVRGRMVYVQFLLSWLRHAFAGRDGMPARLRLFARFLRSYCRVETNLGLLRFILPRLTFGPRRTVGRARDVG